MIIGATTTKLCWGGEPSSPHDRRFKKKPMSNTANLAKRWGFPSFIQDTNIIVDLKLLTSGRNVTTMLRAQGKKLNLV